MANQNRYTQEFKQDAVNYRKSNSELTTDQCAKKFKHISIGSQEMD